MGIAHPPSPALTAASVLGHSEAPQSPAKPRSELGDGLGGKWAVGAQGAICEVGAAHRGKVSAPQKCPSRQFLDDCNLLLGLEMRFCCGLPFLRDK